MLLEINSMKDLVHKIIEMVSAYNLVSTSHQKHYESQAMGSYHFKTYPHGRLDSSIT